MSKEEWFITPEEEYVWGMRDAARKLESTTDRRDSRRYSAISTISVKPRLTDPLKKPRLLASLVCDEILLNSNNYNIKNYNVVLLIADISGLGKVLEQYFRVGGDGFSKLTSLQNDYFGGILQLVVESSGDVLQFCQNYLLVMWKCSDDNILSDYIHQAIDCALAIQKDYGDYITDTNYKLKIKLGIAAGNIAYRLIGNTKNSSISMWGRPFDELLTIREQTHKSDIAVAKSAFKQISGNEYVLKPSICDDFVRVCGIGAIWRAKFQSNWTMNRESFFETHSSSSNSQEELDDFCFRPILIQAIKASHFISDIKKFVAAPIIKCILANEPFEYISDIRPVVVIEFNILSPYSNPYDTLNFTDEVYKVTLMFARKYYGCINFHSIIHKAISFSLAFGMKGFKLEGKCQRALKFASSTFNHFLKSYPTVELSIAVTMGKTYCGVVGNSLRKEFMIFGMSGARAKHMVNIYPKKITCDQELFINSKHNSNCFALLSDPTNKIADAVYEFLIDNSLEYEPLFSNRPIIEREEEIKIYEDMLSMWLQYLGMLGNRKSKWKGQKILLIESELKGGKSRLLQEFQSKAHRSVPCNRFVLIPANESNPYYAIRKIFAAPLRLEHSTKQERMKILQVKLNLIKKLDSLCTLNNVFEVDFEVTEQYRSYTEMEKKVALMKIFKQLCSKCIHSPWVIAIDNVHFMDAQSWALFPTLMDIRMIFFVMTSPRKYKFKRPASQLLKMKCVRTLVLKTLSPKYSGAYACQVLDVLAIPVDLEVILQSTSNGNLSWIENFLINLLQRNKLVIRQVNYFKVRSEGLVTPPLHLIHKLTEEETKIWMSIMEGSDGRSVQDENWNMFMDTCRESDLDTKLQDEIHGLLLRTGECRACYMDRSLYLEDIDEELTFTHLFLEIFDPLTYFEQMVLKCASVLGDSFPRNLLSFILSYGTQLELAIAIKKLFESKLICCAKVDFADGTNYDFVKKKMMDSNKSDEIQCECRNLFLVDCYQDLPKYASCGFMRFKCTKFRSMVYGSISLKQKLEYHSKAIVFLEERTVKCKACGNKRFTSHFITRLDEERIVTATQTIDKIPFVEYGAKIRNSRSPTLTTTYNITGSTSKVSSENEEQFFRSDTQTGDILPTQKFKLSNKIILGPISIYNLQSRHSLVRSFSDSDFVSCECSSILMNFYTQIIRHCRGSGQMFKMLENMKNHGYVCIKTHNLAEGLSVLRKALDFTGDTYQHTSDWKKQLYEAKIHTLIAMCLRDIGELDQAFNSLHTALKKYGQPFPNKCFSRNIKKINLKIKQKLSFYLLPGMMTGRMSIKEAVYCTDLAECLGVLCQVYISKNMWEEAELAALWSLEKVLMSQIDFSKICDSFANMLKVEMHFNNSFPCIALEVHALRYCHKKQMRLEFDELVAVGRLYNMLLYSKLQRSELENAIQLGYIAVRISISTKETSSLIFMLPVLITTLIMRLYLEEAASLLYELEYYSYSNASINGKIWYHAHALLFQIMTGYVIVPYRQILNFYISDDIQSVAEYSSCKQRLLSCMWVWSLRNEYWEQAKCFEKQNDVLIKNNSKTFMADYTSIIVTEGLMLLYVHKLNQLNLKQCVTLKAKVEMMLKRLSKTANYTRRSKPYLQRLISYYYFIKNDLNACWTSLDKCQQTSIDCHNSYEERYSEFNRLAWNNQFSTKLLNSWKDHASNELFYKDLENPENEVVFFYFPPPRYL